MTNRIYVTPRQLRKGDVLPSTGGYTVLADPVITDDTISVKVRYTGDGGVSVREWDADTQAEFPIERAEA